MATIVRFADPPHAQRAVPLNLEDLGAEASRYVAEVKGEAAEIIAQAKAEADSIRQQAAKEGAQAAVHAVDQMVAEKLAPVLAALQQAAADLQDAKQTWLSHWESSAVHLSVAIAARVIRGEVRRQPEISIRLIREALELAGGSPNTRLHLNPEDYKTLGAQVQALIGTLSGLGGTEVAADATISRGGCRVETRFGTIDQQFESQLRRIEEELTA